MHTKLSQFCAHFDSTVRPLLAPIGTAIDALARGESGAAGSRLCHEFEELRHQLVTLVDKVESQQAYVLIFGPLKSGKSTLMNAIAASYVSEVSSLPAYPCLVFVRHGENKKFEVTDYAGTVEHLTDPKILHTRIDAAHKELAETMRATEQRGEQFDPQQHLPTAIRRVDVHVEAKNLANSGAVLVDTPGLYTRMRFGYDRMTRDFRNAAACAIFVVKSDTLFLEQVFAEFDRLLDLFSRIFLVVNMDTAKRDVGPFGELTPSLEQKSPERIIEAFESLAMSAPLKKAAEAGRVQIYTVDLMSAASDALKVDKSKDREQDSGDKSTKPKQSRTGFEEFHSDLEDYLASTDYLKAFLSDSLKRAHTLIGEAERASTSEVADFLRGQLADVEHELEHRRDELHRLDKARDCDWTEAFARYAQDLTEEVERRSRDQGARVARSMSAAIETWFLSSHSLEWLMTTVWTPLVHDYLDAVLQAAQRTFDQSCAQDGDGLDLDAETAHLLRALDVDVYELRRAADSSLGPTAWPSQALIPLDWDAIPIRKRLIDVAMFRSEDKVRVNLLGPPDKPDHKIPSRRKMAMLGEAAKHYMSQFLLQFRRDLFGSTVQETLRRFGDELQRATVQGILRTLEERKPGLTRRIAELEEMQQNIERQLEPLNQLNETAGEIRAKVHALATQYTATAPESLLDPINNRSVLEPAPPRTTPKSPKRSRKSHAPHNGD